ncbi:hypothetical protein PYW08_011714 [Mythimna loreyi]|uniref:Uncharacterized protein n=1 Tax=Mythimna loreyi TaxID=667449 RepID=A0ACC2QK88_9NEOP|nr:hypothetical protein PYW08_011714 [Mythimna loreyi]
MLYPLDEKHTMQANYPKKLPVPHWDRVHLQCPVRKCPETGISSETIGRKWKDLPEVLKEPRTPIEELKNYFRDYNITKQLTRSQTAEDFGFKLPETKRFNKHTSCTENQYVYPQPRRIEDRVPQCSAHGTTEMRSRFTPPVIPPRLITNKDQYKLPTRLPQDPIPLEPSWRTELEPIDTTHEGFEKYLDPYLTTSRLHHRPYTAEQLQRPSCNKDVVTYYTFKDITYTRTPKPETEWQLPVPRPKSVYDREKFKEGFREIRTHNKLKWVPGTFRTEVRDNFIPPTLQPVSQIHNYEEEARSYYEKSIANLSTNIKEEYDAFQKEYSTENSVVGSRKPICSVLDQFTEKNKRLERKSVHIG